MILLPRKVRFELQEPGDQYPRKGLKRKGEDKRAASASEARTVMRPHPSVVELQAVCARSEKVQNVQVPPRMTQAPKPDRKVFLWRQQLMVPLARIDRSHQIFFLAHKWGQEIRIL